MNRLSVFTVLIILSLLVLAQCSDKPTEPAPVEVRQLSAGEQALVESGNDFGLNLFREIVAQEPADSNIFISPLSVAMALGMTYNGARGETQEAMQEVLELSGMDLQEVNESYQSLIELLRGLDDDVEFNLANSIWYADYFSVEQDFIDLNQTYFDAIVRALDFEDPVAKDIINAWVNENTRGKIETIIDEIPPQMVMYLINAIYFKANWSEPFDKDNTFTAQFTRSDGSQVPCEMMIANEKFAYYRGDDFSLVDIPYGDSLYSMTVLLPDSNENLSAFLADLTEADLDLWLSAMAVRQIHLGLPKFELEYKLKLNDVLKALGMEIAFDPTYADFTGINKGGDLYIDEVMHKTYVKVDEEGTEAAAVTSVGVGLSCMPPSVFADHPFALLIRENHSGTILFIGKITEPRWEG